jgi:hypothetical protein
MRTLLPSSVRHSALKIVPAVAVVLSFTATVLAGPQKTVRVSASGQIFPSGPCLPPTDVCQDVQVTGIATVLGRVSGELSEQVNLSTGAYAGTGVFTTADGSTITTAFEGQVIPYPDGTASFRERHRIVDGTGQYENASGDLDLTGTADALGHVDVVGTGRLIRG